MTSRFEMWLSLLQARDDYFVTVFWIALAAVMFYVWVSLIPDDNRTARILKTTGNVALVVTGLLFIAGSIYLSHTMGEI